MTTTTITRRIEQALAWKGYTRDQAATMLGLKGAWALYMDDLPQLADLLGVRRSWLVDGPDASYLDWCRLVARSHGGRDEAGIEELAQRLAATCYPRAQAPNWRRVFCGDRQRRRRAYREPYAVLWVKESGKLTIGQAEPIEVTVWVLWMGRNRVAEAWRSPDGWQYRTMLPAEPPRFGSLLPFGWMARLAAVLRVRAQLDRLVGRCRYA